MSEETDFSPFDTLETQDELSLSLFALHLTNPIITLYVGNPHVKYHVHEDTLRKLSSFRAILDAEDSIDMSEDEPEAVAVLIRCLYRTECKYKTNRLREETLKLREAPEEASEGLLEGLFHLEVCIVASKYEYAELFRHAQDQLDQTFEKLEAIDGLRLWNAEINSGLRKVYTWPLSIPANVLPARALRGWVRALFDTYPSEACEIMRNSPELCIRILDWCTLAPSPSAPVVNARIVEEGYH